MVKSTVIPVNSLDLADLIKPGETVVVGQATGEPLSLTRQLAAQGGTIGGLIVFLGVTVADTFTKDVDDRIAFRSYGAIGGAAQLSRKGKLEVVPCRYSALPGLFAQGILRADVVLLQLSPDRGLGSLNLGVGHDYVLVAARRARLVIAEVNEHMPSTYGGELPNDLRIDHLVASSVPPVELKPAPATEVARRIAAHVAELVKDGATIETGVGAVPDAILAALGNHRDLGIHSGMISDRAVDLIEAGVVTNAHKSFDRGVTIAGALWGTKRLNAFCHSNPAIRLSPISHTHRYEVLAKIPRFTAINSAIEVDLTGQVNAEVADGRYIGAIGGQGDFVRGANASEGGRSIIALPATAKEGTVSRIVPALSGGVVTTPRSDADVFVTEYGVAELRGQMLGERARRMIEIAAPQFRDELSRTLKANLDLD